MFKQHIYIALILLTSFASCKKEPSEEPSIRITNFYPHAGPYSTLVTVTGSGFSNITTDNKLTINGMEAEIQAASPTELRVEVPLGADSGPISVQVAGKSIATSQDIFHYVFTGTVSTFVRRGLVSAPRGLAIDGQGNLLVTNHGGSATINKVSPSGNVSLVAGSGVFGYVDGPVATAQFSNLSGIVVNVQGTIYVSDWGNHCIRKISPAGVVSTLAGNGTAGYADGTGTAAQFNRPEGLTIDAQGNVLVADSYNNRIRLITPSGVVSTLAGSNVQGGFADGLASRAQFYWPNGVAVDAAGTVYVADTGNNRIRKISSTGTVSTLAGTAQCGGTDGATGTATFNYPTNVALNARGKICVAEANGYRIRLLDPDGFTSTLAGVGNACTSGASGGYVDGAGSTAQFNSPRGIAFGPAEEIYVADEGNDSVRKIILN